MVVSHIRFRTLCFLILPALLAGVTGCKSRPEPVDPFNVSDAPSYVPASGAEQEGPILDPNIVDPPDLPPYSSSLLDHDQHAQANIPMLNFEPDLVVTAELKTRTLPPLVAASEIQLTSGSNYQRYSLVGRVIDDKGIPQPDAHVIVVESGRDAGFRSDAFTDRDGYFKIEDIVPNARHLVLATVMGETSTLIGRTTAIPSRGQIQITVSQSRYLRRSTQSRRPAQNVIPRLTLSPEQPAAQQNSRLELPWEMPPPPLPRWKSNNLSTAWRPAYPTGRQQKLSGRGSERLIQNRSADLRSDPSNRITSRSLSNFESRRIDRDAGRSVRADQRQSRPSIGTNGFSTPLVSNSPITRAASPRLNDRRSQIRARELDRRVEDEYKFSRGSASTPTTTASNTFARPELPWEEEAVPTTSTNRAPPGLRSRPSPSDRNPAEMLPKKTGLEPATTSRRRPEVAALSGVATRPAPAAPSTNRSRTSYTGPKCQFQGNRLVDFELMSTNQSPIRFQELGSDLILIDFWATWCGPCLRAIPHLVELQNKYGRSGLQVVGIAYDGTDPSSLSRVKARTRELSVNYPTLVSKPNSCPVKQSFGVNGFPTLVLLDHSGQLLWRVDALPDARQLWQLEQIIQSHTRQ